MKRFQTILLREKFIIQAPNPDMPDIIIDNDESSAIVALSNRIELFLETESGYSETYVVRAQNMHACTRLAGHILRSAKIGRTQVLGIDEQVLKQFTRQLYNPYEVKYNPGLWACVYHNNKPIFQCGDGRHVLLDMIEKCYVSEARQYDKAVVEAEKLLKKTGRDLRVIYDANTALVVDYKQFEGRNGIIWRSPDHPATFSFLIQSKQQKEGRRPLNYSQCMFVAAGYLEGIQLSFLIGAAERRKRLEEIGIKHEDYKRALSARDRIKMINAEIINLETTHNVLYRAERPVFNDMIRKMAYAKTK